MTTRAPRPSFSSKRPLSAIFIGSGSSSSVHLPDLPDIPIENSPTSSSGLPSPPATNSTGSGSTKADAGSTRRPLVTEPANMHTGNLFSENSVNRNNKGSSEEEDGDDGGDHTAKLSGGGRLPLKPRHSDNLSALQRVKSLTQRNRAVLDKLASISSGSRFSTPSPSNSRSPAPPPASSSSFSSSRQPNPITRRGRGESFSGLSGSETEREHVSTTAYSSDDQISPPSVSTVPFRSESVRQRRISAPESPDKATVSQVFKSNRDATLTSNGVQASPRKRPMSAQSFGNGDLTSAALAAVASSRRSPTASRRRQPLPKEFRDRRSLDGAAFAEPTIQRYSDRAESPAVRAPSPSVCPAKLNDSPQSPRARTQRFSTVRDLTRRHQIRWLSQDLPANEDESVDIERKQTRRGGSDESALSPTVAGLRSVVGESLRAAGLAKKRDTGEDIFSGDQQSVRRGGSDSRSAFSAEEPRTPATLSQRATNRNSYTAIDHRPSTSAGYHDEPRTAPLLRSHKSHHILPERARQATLPAETLPLRTHTQSASQERAYASPSIMNGRHSSLAALTRASDPSAIPEHSRLMLSSLSMFESHLARLPTMGTTTTVTIPELFRSAQNIVHSVDSLNSLIRAGTARALEQQIEAEVGDREEPADLVDVWRIVGSEYRENLRVSDELVRTMTDFLLGVGKLLREATPNVQTHSRTSSLDGDNTRRSGSDFGSSGKSVEGGGGRSSMDGRRSTDIRRSLDHSVLIRSNENGMRPGSRAEFLARPSSSLSTLQNQDHDVIESDALQKRSSQLTLNTNMRRVFVPNDQPAPKTAPAPIETSQQDYEPSPTPLSRYQTKEVRRSLPPLAVPPPLSTLPSESLINNNKKTVSKSVHRPRLSNASTATVRAGSVFTPFTPSNTTVTVTTTPVSASTERLPLRSDSLQRSRSTGTSGQALAGLQKQFDRDDRQRTMSTSSNSNSVLSPRTPMSGSETERPIRRGIMKTPRASLDSIGNETRPATIGRRERRMTVTELFSRN